jgi:hypothetical protein
MILRWRWHIWFLVCLFFTGGASEALFAQNVTVQDVVDGIHARQSKITDMRLQYSWKVTRTNFFYELAKHKLELQAMMRKAKAATSKEKEKGQSESRETLPPKETLEAYLLLIKGNKVAYDDLNPVRTENDELGPVQSKVVFDGVIEKVFDPVEKRGLIRRTTFDDVLPSAIPSRQFHLGGRTILAYLSRKDVAATVLRSRAEDGDVLVDLRTQQEHKPGPVTVVRDSMPTTVNGSMPATRENKSSPVIVITEYLVTINTSKSFWPTSIQEFHTIREIATGHEVRTLASETRVPRFHFSNGVAYPSSILTKKYDSEAEHEKWKVLPTIKRTDVVYTTLVTIASATFNSGLSDAAFDLSFPAGSRYLDTRDRETYIVDAAGTVSTLGRSMHLSVSQYTMKQVAKEGRTLRNTESLHAAPTQGCWRAVVLTLCLIGLGICTGCFSYRRLRRRQSSLR